MECVTRTCVLMLMVAALASCEKNSADISPDKILPSHLLQTAADLDSLMMQIGNARIVMLGEASHGTAEFYEWRAAITKRLVSEKGFNMMAIEGEWADSYRVNQFIQGPPKDSTATVNILRQYDRWPTWMWGNYHIASLVTWLNHYNQTQAPANKVGFYGMDVYCLWESMQELLPYLQGNDSLRQIASSVQQCFQPFSADPGEYANAVANASANCREQTQRLWQAVLNYTGGRTAETEAGFVMQQNALVALNGEKYYRTSASSYDTSWNVRDRHMMQTIERLLEYKGQNGKLIVWAHNTHVGDARYTDMAQAGMVNVGQLVREKYGRENVYAVGFGTYQGTVIASRQWGGPIENMKVPAAQKGSWEDQLHRQSAMDKILFSNEISAFMNPDQRIGNRAIGVQYNPANESGNYVPTIIPSRYDAFVFLDRSTALRPLGTRSKNEPPDTYPSGY